MKTDYTELSSALVMHAMAQACPTRNVHIHDNDIKFKLIKNGQDGCGGL